MKLLELLTKPRKILSLLRRKKIRKLFWKFIEAAKGLAFKNFLSQKQTKVFPASNKPIESFKGTSEISIWQFF